MDTDKLIHALCGALVFAMTLPHIGWGLAFVAVMVAALTKEAYDGAMNLYDNRMHRVSTHDVDAMDFIWTVGGGWVAMMAQSLVYALRGQL